MKRRTFIVSSIAGGLWAAGTPAFGAGARTKVALLGQALIEHDLPPALWPGRDPIAALLGGFDVCFTNFESVILGPRAGKPTRELLTLHAAKPDVLDTLKAIKINLMATANNHAFDLGSGGILDTVAAIREAKIAFAGSGANLKEAAAHGIVNAPAGPVALVAFATGKVREGGAATDTRAGVNELRRDAAGKVLEEDASRVLQSIAAARRAASVVLAYQHNHDWEPELVRVPEWQRAFARRCIDAGASVFVGHGVPMLQGVETYKGAPILFGLGNFIFQTEKEPGAYGQESWQSVIVGCEFADGRCQSVKFMPITLNEIGLQGPQDMASRGAPSLAPPQEANRILAHLADLSAAFGTQFQPRKDNEPLQLTL